MNRYFYEHELSDGLPIVPPTREKIEAFLRYTDRDPDEVLGMLLPDNRAATVWSVAVNGVMAGCRPEYMPVLVALVEAMADPHYGVEHSGNTPGGETLIILNGPIIKELGFNYTQGVMRDGFHAEYVGRPLLAPVPAQRRGLPAAQERQGDLRQHLARRASRRTRTSLQQIGWEPNSVEMGFNAGDNTVTIARYTGGTHISSVSGSTPEEMLPYLADAVLQLQQRGRSCSRSATAWHAAAARACSVPIIAETIAKAGWSKHDVKQYLFDHARMPAWEFERYLRDWNIRGDVGPRTTTSRSAASRKCSTNPTIRTAWCRSCGSPTTT